MNEEATPIAVPVEELVAAAVPQTAQQLYPGLEQICERLCQTAIVMMFLEWFSTLIYIAIYPKCAPLIVGSAAGIIFLRKKELRGLDFYMVYIGVSNVIWFEHWRSTYYHSQRTITTFHYSSHTLVQMLTIWAVVGYRHYDRWFGIF